jgi:acetyltransferase-like isoleucine patch superfamily enzyme
MRKISKRANIGNNARIGEFVIIHDDVTIGDDAIIESFCELGYSNGREAGPLFVGDGAHIRSHSVLYLGSSIGDHLRVGHHAAIRENSKIGNGFQLGTSSIVMGECSIGEYVKTGSQVEIGQRSRLGNFIWLFLNSMLLNDPRPPSAIIVGPDIGDFAVIGAGSAIFPGVRVGEGSLVGAGCILSTDVPAGQIAVGNPPKLIGSVTRLSMPDGTPAYPWRYRFQAGYPQDIVEHWLHESANLQSD